LNSIETSNIKRSRPSILSAGQQIHTQEPGELIASNRTKEKRITPGVFSDDFIYRMFVGVPEKDNWEEYSNLKAVKGTVLKKIKYSF